MRELVRCYYQLKGEFKEFVVRNAKINLQIGAQIGLAIGNN